MPHKVKTVNKPAIHTEVTTNELISDMIEDISKGQAVSIL